MKPVFPPQSTTYSDIMHWDSTNSWWIFSTWMPHVLWVTRWQQASPVMNMS